MAKVRVVPEADWKVLRKYLTDDDFEGTVVLVEEKVAKKTGLDKLNLEKVRNPEVEQDINVYMFCSDRHPAIKEIFEDEDESGY